MEYKWFRILIVFAVILVGVDLFVLHRQSHFSGSGLMAMDGWVGFYGLLGFAACAALVVMSRLVGYCLRKHEGFYDDDF